LKTSSGARQAPSRATAGRFVALVRGINLGRARRVAMADLRDLVERLGGRDVRTLLNSGNVVFSATGARSDAFGARIEKAMATRLGVAARVTVLEAAEVREIVARNPLLDVATDPSRLLVAVLGAPADRARLRPLLKEDWSPDALAVGRRVAYLWCSGGIMASPLPEAVGRLVGERVTSRNWATLLRIDTLMADERPPRPRTGGDRGGA